MFYTAKKQSSALSYVEYNASVDGCNQEMCTCYNSIKRSKQTGELVEYKAHDKAKRIAKALNLLEKLENISSKTSKKEILDMIQNS